MKLIDKSALVAEIKRLIAFYSKEIEDNKEDPWAMDIAKRDILQEILPLIDTLKVKEVDLEKEFDSFAYTLPRGAIGDGPIDKHFDDPKIIEARNHGWRHIWSYKEALKIAKHFFELGLKAQKGE